MAYSNNRSDWSRDRNERWRNDRERDPQYSQSEDDDSRLARDSMERDHYGNEGRGGYGGRDQEEQSPRYGREFSGGYGQGDRDQNYSQSGYGRREFSAGEGRRHFGNQSGGWEGREREQWRNRGAHGEYDRGANYGGFSSSGTGNYRGYGGSGGSYQGGQGRWGEAGTQYSQGESQGDYNYRGYEGSRQGYGRRFGQGSGSQQYEQRYGHGPGSNERPSGGRAYGDYSGSPSGYFGDEYGSQGQGLDQYGAQGSQAHQWGQEQYGEHRGRGPRGYKRSDDRIKEEVCECLTDDDRLDASNIDVAVKDGEVTLSGFVTSRSDKRWAETLAERIPGVKEVQNSIRLQDQQRTQAQSSTQGASATGTSSAGASRGGEKGKDTNIQH